MARLIARQMDRSGSVTPPDSELEARLAHMGVGWETAQRPAGPADHPSVSVGCGPGTAARTSLVSRPRTAFTLPSESSTSGAAAATSRSTVPPLDLPSSLLSAPTGPARRPAAPPQNTGRPAHRQTKPANVVDRLPLLRKASFLRVSVDSLSFDPVFVRSVSSAPDAADTRVYLEYELPLETSASARRSTRLGGKKIATETALNHRSVIPLRLTAAGVRLWQASELQLTALGQAGGRCWTLAVAALPLRQLLRQPRLALSRRLPLTLRAAGRPLVGHVGVRLELGSDRDDFPAALAAGEKGKRRRRTRRKGPTTGGGSGSDEDGLEDGLEDELQDDQDDQSSEDEERETESGPVSQEEDRRVRTEPCLTSDAEREPAEVPPPTSERSAAADASSKVRLVHWAVRVGRGTPAQPGALRNTYLVVRAPWLQRAATSVTCWGEEEPNYDYTLISPVLLTAPLVARLHNNLLVVEVWQRSQAPGQDRLVGLSRLPLERLYLTFSQPDVTDTVLQMKSPVLVHEGRVSVTNPDSSPAQLELTLAAGTQQQVDAWMAPQRRRSRAHQESSAPRSSDCTMKLTLGRLLHVPEINEAKSGEVDCFVQYTWPVQDDSGELRLRSFTTEPAISRVNPPLAHTATHRYRAPASSHLADAFVAACAPDAGARWDVVVRTFYPAVRDTVIARGVLSSSQIFGLVEACREDGRQSRRFAVPLQLLSGGEDPAHPSLEVSLTVETAPSAPGSRTELTTTSSSGETDTTVRPTNQLPTWTDVIAGRTNQARGAAGPRTADLPRVGAAEGRFEPDPASEAELLRPVREVPVTRRHTWVCGETAGEGGWAARPGRSPVRVTREEGSQTDLDSQPAVSQEALAESDDSPPVSQAGDPRPAESRSADSRPAEEAAGGSRPDGASGSSEESAGHQSGAEHSDEADSQPSSESEMLRRLRRPLGPPSSERPTAEAPVPESRTATDRADILSDIERDLERLRRTGSIFSGQRRAEGPVDDTTQTDDVAEPAGRWRRLQRGPTEAAPVPVERGGGGDAAARRRSWAPPVAAAADCRSEYADVPLLEPNAMSKGREEREHQVLHVRTETGVGAERAQIRSSPGGNGMRGSAAVPSSESVTPATRTASSMENAPTSNGRTIPASQPAPLAPSRGGHSSSSAAAPARATSSASHPGSSADSWVSAVTPATRPASSLAGPVSPGSVPPSVTEAPRAPAAGGDADGEGAFRAQLTVVEALHLPRIVRGEKREQPRVLVSVQTAAGVVASPLQTGTRPRWNWSQTVWIGRELLQQEFHYLVLKVWHRSGSGRDRVLGLVLIDLVPLLHGLNELLGWYNIVDLAGVCRGQMKLSLRPLDDVPCVERESLDLSVSLDDPDRASYVTTSCHSSFPSHLTRYPELAIRAVNRAHHTRDSPLDMSPGRDRLGPGPSGHGSGAEPVSDGARPGGAADPLSDQLLDQLLPSVDECQLMDGTRSFLVSVLRKNLDDLDSLRAGLLSRVEPDWTSLLPTLTNRSVPPGPASADRSGCSSRAGQVRSRSPHTASGQGRARRASEPESQSRVDSRTYTSLTNGDRWDSGSAGTSVGGTENRQLGDGPARLQRRGDPTDSFVYVRAMNDVSSGNHASEVFCHRREVRGGPTEGSQVSSAPVGRVFSEQETAELRRRGSGASGTSGGGELPSSVVELIETAVRRSAEVPDPPAAASSDSDSLPFGDNLRSLNDTSESERGGASAPSQAELFLSILQEMEARDGGGGPRAGTAARRGRCGAGSYPGAGHGPADGGGGEAGGRRGL
ncbi:C2 domain-containing protein 3-like [Amphibalanus amphitrite]|uniref:C2 domain-containing protein 3-like n=1 Tax=Amphibalanus amphitrite TaxID=1232801 RepID=UPI001C90721C|nr:C2 domain-containing protein 3-like [Amphibalanus amphitrite]